MKILQGVDLVKVKRIEEIYSKYSKKFLTKIFSNKEVLQINCNKKNKLNKIAGKFAAKEAVAKAIGTGFSEGITFKSIEILNQRNGRPTIKLKGKAKRKLQNLVSSSISITDEDGYVISVATFLVD